MSPRGKILLILATGSDWVPVLDAFEQALSVKYIESGMFLNAGIAQYQTYREVPNFGEIIWGDANHEKRFLILDKETPIHARSLRLNTGETRYVIDHENNPESIVLSPGGILEEPKAVIQGEISKLSTLDKAEEIYRVLSKLIKKSFPAIKAYRVGSAARRLGNEGYRLTSSIRRPAEYDLNFE